MNMHPKFQSHWTRAHGLWPVDLSLDPLLEQSFNILRGKWGEVPGGVDRIHSAALLELTDGDLESRWDRIYDDASAGASFRSRGWAHALYGDVFRGKRVLEVGSGLGVDTVFYQRAGAQVTFVDIVESNVRLVERICRLKGLSASGVYIENLRSLAPLNKFDFIYCSGSMHHIPLEASHLEAQYLLRHLEKGGRWLQLAYPKTRWLREGSLSPERWGDRTDGGAPWVDWHNLEKLEYMLAPTRFDVVLSFEFHDSDFNWFDLLVRGPR